MATLPARDCKVNLEKKKDYHGSQTNGRISVTLQRTKRVTDTGKANKKSGRKTVLL
jgi:hypothetical protein